MTLTKAQRTALRKVFMRFNDADTASYLIFRRTVVQGWGCIMVPFAGMWLGIEPDGYTHSQVHMVIDRKTGKPVQDGDTLIRRDYKGFKHRYEVIELAPPTVHVRKLTQEDRWVYLSMPLSSLQLDEVML